MTKRYGPPSGVDIIAAEFRRRGLDFDVERLEDRVAATKSRKKINADAAVRNVEALASTVKRARRECELEEAHWRRNPSADNLAAARAAQQARNAVEAELREQCLNDEQLIADLMLRYGRR